MKNYYFLFGYDACHAYVQDKDHETIQDKANEIMQNDYDVYHYDEHSPLQLLNAFCGWSDFAPISEELYDILKENL
jgi:hypothetical protein